MKSLGNTTSKRILANQDIAAFIDVVEAENRVTIHKMLGKTSFDVADAMLKARGEEP